jgi:hypothetical protein
MARRTKQTIPPNLVEKWASLYRRGDAARIATELGVSDETISIALKHGQATPEIAYGISKYYSEREKPDDIIKKAQQILK